MTRLEHTFYLVWDWLKETAMSRRHLALEAYKQGYAQAVKDIKVDMIEREALNEL